MPLGVVFTEAYGKAKLPFDLEACTSTMTGRRSYTCGGTMLQTPSVVHLDTSCVSCCVQMQDGLPNLWSDTRLQQCSVTDFHAHVQR